MKLGIFGGTFDPPHVGHLIVADDAAAALNLDRVLFVPTGEHPLKGGRVCAPAKLRLEMIEAATDGYRLFEVDPRELRRAGPSFTIDTIEEVADERPDADLFLLIGSDILGEIQHWHRIEELSRRARIAVMTRADAENAVIEGVDIDTLRVEVSYIGVSSSEIRDRIEAGRPYRYLVPDSVYEIIREHKLYGLAGRKSDRRQ